MEKAKKENKTKQPREKVNPFTPKLSYVDFLKELGKEKVDVYLKDICSKEQIEHIKRELELIKNK